jgi:hypothetical protein
MKYVKIQFTEEEFDEIMRYGIFDIAHEFHEKIMEHIRQKETRKNGNRKQYMCHRLRIKNGICFL